MNSKTRTGARLSLENLETRCTPTVSLTTNHSLWIAGTTGPETVTVSNTTVGGVNCIQVNENGVVSTFKTSQLSGGNIFFYGSSGVNTLTNRSNLQLVAYGGPLADSFTSSSASFIYGQGGNDTIDCSVATGQVVIYGGDGNDTVTGGSGNDFIYGGFGNDKLTGGAGNDVLDGGEGNNVLDGGLGADMIWGGGSGDNTIYAGPANDYSSNQIIGGSGNNTIYGGSGGDTIWGGGNASSVTKVYGGIGNDHIYAGQGTSYLYGGNGTDFLVGGSGTNYLYGGSGVDYVYGSSGTNYLDGGIDGSQDYLVGGTGVNHFRRELYGTPAYTANRDLIYNYNATRDQVYT